MIIDCHAHIFPDELVDRAIETLTSLSPARPVARATVQGLLAHMDECGVDQAVIAPVATRPAQVGQINDWVLAINHPRLLPFGALHPHGPNKKREIKRLVDAGVRGIKLQPYFQDYLVNDPLLDRTLELVDNQLAVLIHGGAEMVTLDDPPTTPERLAKLAKKFPRVRFIMAHLGGYTLWDDTEKYLVGLPILLDASTIFGICSDEQILRIIRNHGPEKIVWGSDFPWQPQSLGLEGLRRIGLTQEELDGILGGNLQREVFS